NKRYFLILFTSHKDGIFHPVISSSRFIMHKRVILRIVPQKTLSQFWEAALYKGKYKDRKSTRLNSSHVKSSYAVFCLKKKIDYNKSSPKPLITKGTAILHNSSLPIKPMR